MNILFLDDAQERHDLAEKYLSKEHILLHCFNADEALEVITSFQGTIGLAMLDHDLMDELTGRYEDGTPFEKHGVYFVMSLISDIPKDKHPARAIVDDDFEEEWASTTPAPEGVAVMPGAVINCYESKNLPVVRNLIKLLIYIKQEYGWRVEHINSWNLKYQKLYPKYHNEVEKYLSLL